MGTKDRRDTEDNVVDLGQYRARKERRKAQQKGLLGGVITIEPEPGQGTRAGAKKAENPREALRRVQRSKGKSSTRKPKEHRKFALSRKAVFGILIAGVVLILSLSAVFFLNLFKVRTVEISGGINFTRAEIMEAAGLKIGQSIFSVNAETITGHLRSTPQLRLVSFSKKYPFSVTLEVAETTPAVVAGYSGQFVTLDEELRVISREGSLPSGNYPLVTGMVIRAADSAAEIQCDDPLQMEALKSIIDAFSVRSVSAGDTTYAALHYLREIQLADVDQLVLITNNGFTIKLGTIQGMERKAMWVEQMIPIFVEKGYTEGTLDVSGSSSATFIPSDRQGLDKMTETQPEETGGETSETETPDA